MRYNILSTSTGGRRGLLWNEEIKEKIRQGNLGKVISQEHKNILSELRKGKASYSKSVQQISLETGEVIREYNSIKEASEINGLNRTEIGRMCNNTTQKHGKYIYPYKHVGGFKWQFYILNKG